jgi:hypothetical protein
MSKYTKLGASSPVTLLSSTEIGDVGVVNYMHIVNESVDTSNTVSLMLKALDSSVSIDDVYVIKNINIPFGATLVLDSIPNFNIQQYDLVISCTTGGTSGLTVIIS